MKKPEIPLIRIDDLMHGPESKTVDDRIKPGQIVVYYTHGFRQYMGTAKFHVTPDCPHLVTWKPYSTRVGRLAKVLLRDNWNPEDIYDRIRCKTCWKTVCQACYKLLDTIHYADFPIAGVTCATCHCCLICCTADKPRTTKCIETLTLGVG